jgi:hypothetical protein
MINSLSRLPERPLFSDRTPYDFDPGDPRGLKHISLEQQKKRAKELLKHWRDNQPESIQRARLLQSGRSPRNVEELQLSDAQHVIAHEHGFKNWADFKTHIEHARIALQAIEAGNPGALDADKRTLHIRCGTDIQHALTVAGFIGDFMPFFDPYVQGPVPQAETLDEFIRIRAGFLEEAYHATEAIELLTTDYADLARARDYPRVVLWFEHDSHDQLILARLFQYFSDEAHRPERLEFISVTHFPGVKTFNGIGHLPPEAMRVLWGQFTRVTADRLVLGKQVWEAVTAPTPEALVALASGDMHALPVMQKALKRHLQELPSTKNGLSLGEQLTLQILADKGPMNAARLFGWYVNHYEPLPYLGDTGYWWTINGLANAQQPAITMDKQGDKPIQWHMELTSIGARLLENQADWITLNGIDRWFGGVKLDSGSGSVWRYAPEAGLTSQPL